MGWKEGIYEFERLQESLDRIDEKKSQLEGLRPFSNQGIRSIAEALSIEWTYNSNSIEGNTLTLHETKMVLEDGFTIKGKSLREHFEVVNHQEAIHIIESWVKPGLVIKDRHILDIHELVLQKIEKEYGGRYRSSGVRIAGANFIPPNALKVDGMVQELLDWLNFQDLELHPLVKASIFHHRFVWIHPFFDGNGRTIRLIYNLWLMSNGYTPGIILRNDRKKYYDALNRANNGDYSKLLLIILQSVERTLDIYLSSISNTHEDYKPISEIVEEDSVPYGQEYVSLLARQGKIDAYKEGRNWYTTQDAIEAYRVTRLRNR